MPLVLFVGLPASGKTTRAKQLLAHLHQHLFPQKALPAVDESKQQPNSPSPPSTAVSTTTSPLPPPSASPSPAATDEAKDSGAVNQLAVLSLSDSSSTQPTTSTSSTPPLSASAATSSSNPNTSFTKSTTPSKRITQTSSSSSTTPSSSSPSPITDLVLINHETLQLPRSTFYASPTAEKQGRSAIRAIVERQLTSSRLLAVDYLNDVKGYRYELWCRAREVGTTYCVVYCEVGRERCVEWNKTRPVDEQYSDAVSDGRTSTQRTQQVGRCGSDGDC